MNPGCTNSLRNETYHEINVIFFKTWRGDRICPADTLFDIFIGFPYNFYHVKGPPISPQEKKLADLLISALTRKISFAELERRVNLPDAHNFVEKFNIDVIQEVELKDMASKLNTPEEEGLVEKALSKVLKEFFPSL